MSLYSSQRRRRRQRRAMFVVRLVVLVVMLGAVGFAWDLGRQEEAVRTTTLTHQLEEQAVRLVALEARQTAVLAENESLQRENARLRESLQDRVSVDVLSGLIEEARRKVADGVSVARLEARVRATNRDLACKGVAEQVILIRSRTSQRGEETASYAGGKIAISLTAQDADGVLPERYHPSHKVRLVAAQTGQVPYVAEDYLPHSFALTTEEGSADYRFLVFVPGGTAQLGTAIVRAERCVGKE